MIIVFDDKIINTSIYGNICKKEYEAPGYTTYTIDFNSGKNKQTEMVYYSLEKRDIDYEIMIDAFTIDLKFLDLRFKGGK